MSLSGTYTFTVTRDDIIREAMLNNGLLYETEVPTSQEVTDMSRKLNMIVKQWQAKADFAPGLKVWTRLRGDLFLSYTSGTYPIGSTSGNWTGQSYNRTTTATKAAGQTVIPVSASTNFTNGDNVGIVLDSGVLFWTTGTISGLNVTLAVALPTQASNGAVMFNYTTNQIRPERIETAVLRDINFNDIPLDIMTLQDYEFLPTKASTNYIADPQAIYYEYGVNSSNSGTIYTDVGAAVDTSKIIHTVFLSPVMDMTNPTDNFQYPQGWYQALSWELSKQSAPMFNKGWSTTQEENRRESLAIAREQFPETESMFFEPKREGSYRKP